MRFPFDLYAGALLVAFGSTLVSLPLWRLLCTRIDLIDDPGHRKIHHMPVPLAGGLAVATGLLAALVGGWIAAHMQWIDAPTPGPLEHGIARRAPQLAAILVGAAIMLAIGILDDRFELRPATKFAGQSAAALLVALVGVRVTLFLPNPLLHAAVTVLWILAVTNAINFLDNMNGLCAGLGAIAGWTLAWAAAVHGQYLVATLAFATTGALLGFIPHNYPRASAFLGDSGSHLVGFLTAVLAILPDYYDRYQPNALRVLTPLLVLAVPLFDLASVLVIRWRSGQPFYVGDTNHVSHRLVRAGFSKPRAVALLWLAAALAGFLALTVGKA